MKTNKKTRIPTLRKCNNRGFVEFNRERVYRGPWGSPETQQAYERAIGEWLSNRCLPSIPQDQLTITELCRDYWRHCTEYYLKPDGSPTSTLTNIKDAMKPLNAIYGSTLSDDFGVRSKNSAYI
jgi:hypothetical protein